MRFRELLTTLARAEVDFVVVGGVAAVLHGVPVATLDLDLVHSRATGNRRRLAGVLESLEACYREFLPRRIVPSEHDLESPLHHLLTTRLGHLDLLGTLHGGLGYAELLPRTVLLPLDEAVQVRILDLRGLIEVKERMGRDKDQAQLSLMRRALEEIHRRSQES